MHIRRSTRRRRSGSLTFSASVILHLPKNRILKIPKECATIYVNNDPAVQTEPAAENRISEVYQWVRYAEQTAKNAEEETNAGVVPRPAAARSEVAASQPNI